jgi:type III secretion protein V
LVVCVLDPGIERTIAELGAGADHLLFDQTAERLVAAVEGESAIGAGDARPPSILTTQDVRPAVRRMLALRFPELPVLSYQDLSPELNIQALARIHWD